MISSSLTIVGAGIKFLSQLTMEAKTYITQSDKVLYLVNEPLMEEWIKKNSSVSESLYNLYIKYPLRLQCYNAITDYILEDLTKVQNLCVVLYGHPTVFAQPALDAVIQAKKIGYFTRVLPGISAEACLFADLLIDPGEYGCHSFEATDFLIRPRSFSPSCHLILWQIGVIGFLGHNIIHDNHKGMRLLVEKLSQHYPPSHGVTIYEAAQYINFESRIEKVSLNSLSSAKVSSLSTLYVPPSSRAEFDFEALAALNIHLKDL